MAGGVREPSGNGIAGPLAVFDAPTSHSTGMRTSGGR